MLPKIALVLAWCLKLVSSNKQPLATRDLVHIVQFVFCLHCIILLFAIFIDPILPWYRMERNRSWYSIVAGKTTVHESLPKVQFFWACVLLLVVAIKPSNKYACSQ